MTDAEKHHNPTAHIQMKGSALRKVVDPLHSIPLPTHTETASTCVSQHTVRDRNMIAVFLSTISEGIETNTYSSISTMRSHVH